MKDVLILTDNKRGSNNLSIGVGEFLNKKKFNVKELNISYNKFAKLPNFLNKFLGLGICEKSKEQLLKQNPDVIISAGRRLALVSDFLKKKTQKETGKKIYNVVMTNPELSLKKFDLVVLFNHDKPRPKNKNVMMLTLSPNRNNPKKMQSEKKKWLPVFKKEGLKTPFVSVFVGGSTRKTKFTNEMAKDLALKIDKIAKKLKANVLITTSRRTGLEQEKIIAENLKCKNYFYKWGDKRENPFMGFFACGDLHIITGESISMVCEGVATQAPVFIYSNEKLLMEKHKRFIRHLLSEKFARPIEWATDILKTIPAKNKDFMNSAVDVAKKIEMENS